MVFPLICTTVILGAIIAFANLAKGTFFTTVRGQVVHSLVSIACLALVVIAFWRFGWKVGLLNFGLAIIAANVGVT
jgi:hypothetical protein